MIGSVDNKQMVRNLCYSQKYVKWSHFLTFTCNQRDHFGTSNIKKWIDNDEWKSNYPNFYQLELDEQKEILEYIDSISLKIETAINLKQQEIEKLKEYKSSLINSVVTGKVKVC